jgi:nucleoside-diphosphate-sugar epimerase
LSERSPLRTILVTGGAGYVGAVLVPLLLEKGYHVKVLDLYLFGENIWNGLENRGRLCEIKGDIRDQSLLRQVLEGVDGVIHLASISNDPCFELDPVLGRSFNFDAFEPLVQISKASGVRRFIYASTSSVYGVSDAKEVTEDHPLVPITDYNKYKGLCEPILLKHQSPEFTTVILRPATVCGYSPRMRLDLTVNILTAHAVAKGRITVFGGNQMRPNIHIRDTVDLYALLLQLPDSQIAGKTYKAGYENFTNLQLAEKVREVVSQEMPDRGEITIETVPSEDIRSYHICSEKIKRELGFIPKYRVEDAVRDLVHAFRAGKIPNPLEDIRYYNIRSLQQARLN